jgi:uncharacterized protein YgbK (DUF1537 family)
VLQAQLDPARGRRVGLIEHAVVARGAQAIGERIAALRAQGHAFAIADAIADADLRELAHAAAGLALVVAGSGLAIGIPALHGLQPDPRAAQLPPARGARAIVSGSCSTATQAQVAAFIASGGAAFAVDPMQLGAGRPVVDEARAWAKARLDREPVLIYATAEPAAVRAVQQQLGAAQAGALVEEALSRIAQGLVEAGVGQLIIAGGETSGACVRRLNITELRIGPQIDPGVPWCHAPERDLHLALKSGNFGRPSFFSTAFDIASTTRTSTAGDKS